MTEDLTLRVLFVEDKKDTARQLAEYFADWEHNGNRLEAEICREFDAGLSRLESERFDLLVLDVLKGPADANDESGRDAFNSIKARRFIPVIFYTAVPDRVRDLETAVVKVVPKGPGLGDLEESVKGQIDSGLLRANRELNLHFEKTIRDYLWDFVPQHWDELTGTAEGRATLAYLLSRRIASSLDVEGADKLAQRLGATSEAGSGSETRVHPLRYYIIPPESDGFKMGDILREGEPSSYWVVLTPSCDLIPRGSRPPRADYVLLAQCIALEEFKEFTDWREGESPGPLMALLRTPDGRPPGKQEGRYFFLPGVLGIPDMLIDFQQVRTVEFASLSSCEKVATLDSPFAESASSSYLQLLGRLGTPDLDIDRVVAQLEAKSPSDQTNSGTEPSEEAG